MSTLAPLPEDGESSASFIDVTSIALEGGAGTWSIWDLACAPLFIYIPFKQTCFEMTSFLS